jgi:hypothetical protein
MSMGPTLLQDMASSIAPSPTQSGLSSSSSPELSFDWVEIRNVAPMADRSNEGAGRGGSFVCLCQPRRRQGSPVSDYIQTPSSPPVAQRS